MVCEIKWSYKKKNNYVTYANKGLLLEEDINITNVYYRNTDRALIYKKPTPIKIVKVVYPNSKSSKITEAFLKNHQLWIIVGYISLVI